MKIDFRNITSQETLEALFRETAFFQYKDYSFGNTGDAIRIEVSESEDDTVSHQYVWIGEGECMGTLTVMDSEHSGYDALFIQTLVQLFRDGKIKIIS